MDQDAKCPQCGSTNLLEDNGFQCQDCGWAEEIEEDAEEVE